MPVEVTEIRDLTELTTVPAATNATAYKLVAANMALAEGSRFVLMTVSDLFQLMQLSANVRTLLGAANHAAFKSALGLGTAADASAGDFATASALSTLEGDVTAGLAGKAASSHSHAQSDVTGLVAALAAKAASSHTHPASEISDSTAAGRSLLTAADVTAQRTALGLNRPQQAYATAETTLSAAAYADITGASISLGAGTWLVFGVVVGRAVNAAFLMNVAITDGSNVVVCEGSQNVPASGSANVNSTGNVALAGIVTPGSTTTYKLRAARGNAAPTGSWIAVDGSAVAVANNASSNTDKGTGIRAIRIL
jgi:hypothetical protein